MLLDDVKKHLVHLAELKHKDIIWRQMLIKRRREIIDFLESKGYTRDIIEKVIKHIYV